MSEQVNFLNMFAQYHPSDALTGVFDQTAVVAADIDPVLRKISVEIYSDSYIAQRILNQVSQEICKIYGLHNMSLTAKHPASQLSAVEPEELLSLFVDVNSMTRGSLAGANWHWEEQTLYIGLISNGKALLEECVPQVRNALNSRFSANVNIEIQAGEALEGQALFAAMEKMRSTMIEELPKVAAPVKKEQPVAGNDAIFGKSFKSATVPMDQLSLDMGFVTVEGRVFNIENKELTKRNAWVINIDITDNTSSVRISRFLENREAKPILEGINNGDVIKVQGKLLIDNYTNEMVLKPSNIISGVMPRREDREDGMKRVELHLHTTMSNMDALTDTKAAIKQAAAWGHRAIAITDHGCVQSFTDALHTIEGKSAPKVAGTGEDIKILYGCEGYYINDVDDRIVVHGLQDMAFNETFVAFDLETTGLSSQKDQIIEIGAVKICNGKEVDRYQTFVNPGRALEQRIVELT